MIIMVNFVLMVKDMIKKVFKCFVNKFNLFIKEKIRVFGRPIGFLINFGFDIIKFGGKFG